MGVLQIPAGAVVVSRQAVTHGEVAAEHLAAPPAVEADHKVSAVGSVDCDRRFACRNFSGRVEPGKGSMDSSDEVWEFGRGEIVVRDVAPDVGNATSAGLTGSRSLVISGGPRRRASTRASPRSRSHRAVRTSTAMRATVLSYAANDMVQSTKFYPWI